MHQHWVHDARDAVAALCRETGSDPHDPDLAHLVGDLTLNCDTWANPDHSGQRLMVLTAEPDSPTHDALRILASWTAQQTEPDPVQPAGRPQPLSA
ncbi:hypothetical protein ACIP2Y_38400 [Streptomyces sviceus]|uniref:MmyB family transcriptional regulator n=1 Tax=Streptomyces sviceus TaxID=285530 RepID=UPI003806E6BD